MMGEGLAIAADAPMPYDISEEKRDW